VFYNAGDALEDGAEGGGVGDLLVVAVEDIVAFVGYVYRAVLVQA